ncbi:MAG: adenosylcobinamide amidohydrolase [Deltaproteobacteria bacterium]|nr:adenosylcobinamide amidohydrolase [Deltaproteobacteria bacterium]
MSQIQQRHFFINCGLRLVFVLCLLLPGNGWAASASSRPDVLSKLAAALPTRIVSLVPAVTEVIAALNADPLLVGITYHSNRPARLERCTVVGGFMAPSLTRIKSLQPDLVFISDMHENLRAQLNTLGCRVVEIRTSSLRQAFANIKQIGDIVGKSSAAAQLVAELQQQMVLISRKIERIPLSARRRVMRLMECDGLLVPGDDSFQNELIVAAGGIPPVWGKKGVAVQVTAAEVQTFDPQLIYADGICRHKVKKLFTGKPWTGMAAGKSGNIHFFPDVLTCRAATHLGDFVAWLAATIYPDYFSRPENMVLPEAIRARSELQIGLDCVKQAAVVETTIADFNHRTLVVDLTEPMQTLSTLEGFRAGITTVGNHYLPPASWNLVHLLGSSAFEARVSGLLERQAETTSMLFTGADMNNLVQQSVSFREMKVTALVTAGVSSNAVRMGAEEGRYYELDNADATPKPGTINIILLSNLKLTPKAMTRAIISACEGKSAALQDLDIRATSNPAFFQATGTGTDNIVVVEGRGRTIDQTGGHSKMGELIARAVYDGVTEAVRRQNAICRKRSLFQRLQERQISVYEFLQDCRLEKWVSVAGLVAPVEELLLDRSGITFVESSFAISDAWQRSQVKDLESFRKECAQMANRIAGRPLPVLPQIYFGPELPDPLRLALEALVCGVEYRLKTVSE